MLYNTSIRRKKSVSGTTYKIKIKEGAYNSFGSINFNSKTMGFDLRFRNEW